MTLPVVASEAEAREPTMTPKDYHRIHFDTSALPSKRIVGLLACQRDPSLRQMETKVISSKPASVAAPPPARGKEKKKKAGEVIGPNTPAVNGSSGASSDSPVVQGKLWEVELEDTVIFPEGGGQPFDTGTLYVDGSGSSRAFKVEGCLRRKLDSVHLVRALEEDSSIFENLERQQVKVVVDWERRMDHMTLHTSQHLLSAVLDTFAEGLPTLSWSLPAFPSLEAPYVELPRALTWSEAEQVEKRCNDFIEENRRIWVDVDIQQEGYVKMTAAGIRENRGIPQDYNDGVIRHINIDGIDRNACCGTQLPFLSQLYFLHVIPPSTPKDSNNPTKTPSKLYFVSGPRAIKFLQQSSRTLSEASQVLGMARLELPQRVAKAEELRRETMSREKTLRTELARVIGDTEARNPQSTSDGVYWIHRNDKSTLDFEFMGLIATSLLDAQPPSGPLEAPVVIISATANGITPSLLLVMSPAQDLAKKVYENLKTTLEEGPESKGRVKGGGARGRFMSKVDGKWSKGETAKVQAIADELRASSGAGQ